jgi:hypothetical protein
MCQLGRTSIAQSTANAVEENTMLVGSESQENATRRSFLRNTSLAAGAIAAASTNVNAQEVPAKTGPGPGKDYD